VRLLLARERGKGVARAFRFAAAFKPGKLDKAWIGELSRSR